MKTKFLSLLTLLVVCVTGAWAQDLDVEFTSSTSSNWLKNWTTEGVTLSGSGGFSSSSGYYYSGCSSNAGAIDSYYFGISAISSTKKISKVSIFVSPNNSSKVYPVFIGWSETPSLKNVACYKAIAGTSTSNTKANGEWITYDLESENVSADISQIRIYRKVSAGNFYESEEATKSIGDGKDLGAGVTLRIWKVKVWLTDTKTISTQALAGVKKGGTTLTETTDYTIDGTTITLTAAHKAVSAPTVALINHITYTDATFEDKEVSVTLGAASEGFFSGTATIGATNYTIKVPVSTEPSLTLSATSGSVTLKSWETTQVDHSSNSDPKVRIAAATFTLTGANLTDGVYGVSADGLIISPTSFTVEDGAVSQEFKVYTTATTAASTEIEFTADETSVTYTLNMTKPAKRSLSQSIVTEATTWDWANAASEEILLTKDGSDKYDVDSDPARGDEFLMAILPEVTNNETFNSQALIINTQYVKRTGDYFQGNSVKFKTNLSGSYKVIVWFSNTGKRGDSDPNRLIYIDGVNTEVGSKNTTFVSASATLELTGVEKEIVINAFTDDVTPASTMVRIQKIVFMPASVSGTISSIGWNSFASAYPLDLSTLSFSSGEGAAYYAYDKDIENNVITLSSTNATIAAGEGILIKGEAGETFSIHTKESGDALSGNLLVGVTANSTPVSSPYVLAGAEADKPYFQQYSGSTMNANSAYLPSDVLSATADRIRFVIEGEQNATGMEDVKAGEDVIKFIENGQLLIKKNGIVYDVTGRIVK